MTYEEPPSADEISNLVASAMEVIEINATVAAAYYLKLVELGIPKEHAALIAAGFVGGYGNTAPKMVSQVS